MDFDTRAHLSEWMDEPCSYDDFRDCLRDLAQVNRLTFAYRPTLAWLSKVVGTGNPPVHIVDVGCGGGDTLRAIETWAKRNEIAVRLTGIDLNPHAARAALELGGVDSAIEWVTGDALSYTPTTPIDVVVSSLFTHHLGDGEIVAFLQWMEGVARKGWFINDLHRERLPSFGFKVLAAVMRWHRFVRHDGPVSFRRAFRQADWHSYLRAAGVASTAVELRTYRPARLCVSRVRA